MIGVCKTETAKGGKLTSAEVSKYCSCAIESDGKLTNDQKWQIQSAINQKKNPSSLAFVQKQNQDLQACFGPQLTGKLKTLTEAAMSGSSEKISCHYLKISHILWLIFYSLHNGIKLSNTCL